MKYKKILIRKDPVFDKCPSCSEINVIRRSRSKTAFESLLKFTTYYKTYRCKNCGWRGRLPTFIVTFESVKNLIIYFFIAFLSGVVVLQLLKRFV